MCSSDLTYLRRQTEKAMAPHSSTLAWKMSWTEKPGRLQSMGSLESDTTERLHFHFSLSMHWRRKWQPTPVFLPGESQGREACLTAVYGVAQSLTRLKRHSSSSKETKELYTENYKTPMKEIKDDIKDGEIFHVPG